jgi:hypothetical protein
MQPENSTDFADVYCSPEATPEEIVDVYNRYGAAIVKGFYLRDPQFATYLEDLKWCAGQLLNKYDICFCESWTLEQRISQLFAHKPTAPMAIYHLGTQPNKMVSGNLLKFSARNMQIVNAIFGDRAVLAEPAAADTLIGFPPGEMFDRYLLPIHEDFPYLLQSSKQITLWLSLSENVPEVGGVDLFLGSHRFGPYPVVKSREGHYEACIEPSLLESFPRVSVDWAFGDLIIMNCHLLHQGKPNRTADRTRIIQIFRYADLNEPVAVSYEWASKTYVRPGIDAEAVLDLYQSARMS